MNLAAGASSPKSFHDFDVRRTEAQFWHCTDSWKWPNQACIAEAVLKKRFSGKLRLSAPGVQTRDRDAAGVLHL